MATFDESARTSEPLPDSSAEPKPKPLWTVGDVARRLSLGRTAATGLVKRLGGIYIGRALRIEREVVEDYIATGGDRAGGR